MVDNDPKYISLGIYTHVRLHIVKKRAPEYTRSCRELVQIIISVVHHDGSPITTYTIIVVYKLPLKMDITHERRPVLKIVAYFPLND